MLSNAHLKSVCNLGKGQSQCMFLEEEKLGSFFCMKLTGERRRIEEQVKDSYERLLSQGINPKDIVIPMADNCPGFIVLRTVIQGFDVVGQ